jgi:iron(III) transport system substrate-binding protein
MNNQPAFSKTLSLLVVLIQIFTIICCTLSASAKESLRVRLYSHNDIREMEQLIPIAEAATGLKIEFICLSSSQILARIRAEAPYFGADLVWGILNSDAIEAKNSGFLHKNASKEWHNIPEKFKDSEGFWCGWSYWYNTILVNTSLLTKKNLPCPTSWADLLDTRYKGEIVASNPGTSGTAFLAVSSLLQAMGEEKGWEYLKQLDKNIAQYTKSGSAPAHLVAMGEYTVGITWDRAAQIKKDAGFPVKEVVPMEGTGFDLDSIMILRNCKNLDNALQLSNWIVSEKGQKACAKIRSRVVNKLAVTSDQKEPNLFPYNAEAAATSKEKLLEQWKDSFR